MATATIMPLLVLNMGSEMVFVLDQQMRAKKTPRTRRLRELRALLHALHDYAFITALFHQSPTSEHQQPTASATRGLFGRLANAPPSLTVNARAMDVLYDAMRSGFKRQLLASTNTSLLALTLNHLDATKVVVDASDPNDCDDDVGKLVDETIRRTYEAYEELRAGDEQLLHEQLCAFLEEIPAVEKLSGPSYSTLSGRSALEGDDASRSIDDIVTDVRDTEDVDDAKANAPTRAFDATAKDAMALLAELVGTATDAKTTSDSTWKFTLFDEAKDDRDDDDDCVETHWIDARSERKEVDALRDEWDAQTDAKSWVKVTNDEEEDLLRLMDTTAS